MIKTWFVTGASRGIGREVALSALCSGDNVVVTGRKVDEITKMMSSAQVDQHLLRLPPGLAPVRPRCFRRASSSVVRGSTTISKRRSLTHSPTFSPASGTGAAAPASGDGGPSVTATPNQQPLGGHTRQTRLAVNGMVSQPQNRSFSTVIGRSRTRLPQAW